MGKKRIVTVAEPVSPEATAKQEKKQKIVKIKAKIKAKPAKTAKKHGKKYLLAIKKIDKNKLYSFKDAVTLLNKISISQFNASIDVHLVTRKVGLKGEIEFPYPTGKKHAIKVADEQVLKDLALGKINFSLLVASPQMMPKIMKFAKILGPKGLMPNPKNNTISDKPEETAKKLASKTQYKTEAKAPLIHIKIGKADQKESELAANFKALIEAVNRKNIQKAFITPTMGPSIKIDLGSLK